MQALFHPPLLFRPKQLPFTLCIGLLCAFSMPLAGMAREEADSASRLREDVAYLASEVCAGRRVGTEGCKAAMDYLAGRLAELGLEAFSGPGWEGYSQGFDLVEGIEAAQEPTLGLVGQHLLHGQDFSLAQFSGSGTVVDAPIVFVGYGIHAPDLNWDDYAGQDVRGAVVVAVRGEPQQMEAASRFSGTQPSIYADMRRKAAMARDAGAGALILLPNPLPDSSGAAGEDRLPEQMAAYSNANFDIPVLFARRASFEQLIRGAAGCSLADLLLSIDSTNKPIVLPLEAQVSLSVQVRKRTVKGFNLAGLIPGTDPELRGQYIVLGAHYDHLGDGGVESTSTPQVGQIHYGADDNASGVACVLALAKELKERPLRRAVIIALFSAEEEGAIGSAAFADKPPVPQESITAMLNFDMVGRMQEGKLIVEGIGTAAEFGSVFASPLVSESASASGINIAQGQSGFGASDQLNFIRHKHPVLFFFTGVHGDYHKPSDTADKINYDGIISVADYAQSVLRAADELTRITFVEASAPAPGARSSLTVTLGTVPGYTQGDVSGMAISDVRPGGPAALAGMQGGDVITRIDGKRVANIFDFMFALQDKQAGDVVEVVVLRAGEEKRFDVTLAARNVQQ